MTCTNRKRRPMMRERRKIGRTSSGVAFVATSKSFGSSPSIRSRAAPPTMKAAYPASCKPEVTFSAHGLIWSRAMPCCSRGIMRGPEDEGISW